MNDGNPHHAKVERSGNDVVLHMDGKQLQYRVPGPANEPLDLDSSLYVGAVDVAGRCVPAQRAQAQGVFCYSSNSTAGFVAVAVVVVVVLVVVTEVMLVIVVVVVAVVFELEIVIVVVLVVEVVVTSNS